MGRQALTYSLHEIRQPTRPWGRRNQETETEAALRLIFPLALRRKGSSSGERASMKDPRFRCKAPWASSECVNWHRSAEWDSTYRGGTPPRWRTWRSAPRFRRLLCEHRRLYGYRRVTA